MLEGFTEVGVGVVGVTNIEDIWTPAFGGVPNMIETIEDNFAEWNIQTESVIYIELDIGLISCCVFNKCLSIEIDHVSSCSNYHHYSSLYFR